MAAKEGAAIGEKVIAKEATSVAAREGTTVLGKEAAKSGGEDVARRLVALDTNAIIAALKEGKTAAVDAAIGGRIPIVPVAAAKEFIKANGRAGAIALREFLAARGGRLAEAGAEATATGLRAQAASLGRSLKPVDSRVAAGAIREGVPLITNDKKFFNFLQAIGYSVQKY